MRSINSLFRMALVIGALTLGASVYAVSWTFSITAPYVGDTAYIQFSGVSTTTGGVSLWAKAPGATTWQSAGGGGGPPGGVASGGGGCLYSVPGTWTFQIIEGSSYSADSSLLRASTTMFVLGPDITIASVTYASGQTRTIEAVDSITTSGAVTVASGANIEFRAGNKQVRLEPGFHAAEGSVFRASLAAMADADHDGIPNSWEVAHGLNANLADADADPDGDGLTNLQEYKAGTDPLVTDPPATTTLGNTVPAGWPNQTGGDSAAVGLTGGSLNVDQSGALTYSVPIWVSPGTSGVQPQLALNYSSQAGAGISGYGWSLGGISAITRGPPTKAVDDMIAPVTFTSTDGYYLDGKRLVVISGTNGADGSEYRTETESFTRVIAHDSRGGYGPAWFEAWTKAGLRIEFGHATGSYVDAEPRAQDGTNSPGVLNWNVNKITDAAGNYMTFTYVWDSAAREQRLTQIDYTGNATAGLSPYLKVVFNYDFDNNSPRPDRRRLFHAGSRTDLVRRLKSIDCYGTSAVVRSYSLGYTQQPYSGWSLLQSITEADGSAAQFAAGNAKAYHPLTFDYSKHDSTNMSWQLQGRYLPPQPLTSQGSAGTGFVDLDGDGLPDFAAYRLFSGGSLAYRGIWLNRITGFEQQSDDLAHWQLPMPLGRDGSGDEGNRFIDLNGDGRVDFVYAGYYSSDRHVWFNTGQGWTQGSSAWDIPINVEAGDGRAPGGAFVDVDGDGLPDLVVSRSGLRGVYFNNGAGWSPLNTSWWPPVYLNDDSGKDTGVRFVDLNGDGLPDILQGHFDRDQNWVARGAWLNTGSGWSYASAYLPPVALVADDYPIWGAELADVNGDGLVDLVCNHWNGSTTRKETWLNTGSGWWRDANYDAPYNLANCSNSGSAATLRSGSALIDLTQDGLPSMIFNRAGPNHEQQIGIDIPRTYDFQGGSPSGLLMDSCYMAYDEQPMVGGQFVDYDGDGAPDFLWNIQDGTMPSGQTRIGGLHNNTPRPNLLTKVTNGFGVAASVTYAPLTQRDSSGAFTVYDKGTGGPVGSVNIVGPMYVVKQVTNDDGVGGQYPIAYRYGGLRSDYVRGSLGFEWMSVTDGRTDIQTKTTFAQTFPWIGMPLIVETKTTSGTGVTLSKSSTTYDVVMLNSNKTWQPYAKQVVQYSYELDGNFVSGTKTTTTAPDSHGNVTSLTVASLTSTGTEDGFKKTTTSEYAADVIDATRWFLGRLTRSSVTAKAPGKPDITRVSSFTYDPLTGLLKTETVEPGNASAALTLTTTYGYDAFGNKTSASVAGWDQDISGTGRTSTRTTSTTYDTKGRFPASSTNALSQSETYTYDQNFGVIKSLTGPNALTTSWDYDTFGTKIRETRSDSTKTETRIRWVSAATAPDGAVYYVETESTGVAPTLVFHDAFGRAFRSLGLTGNGEIVYQDTRYDAQGRAYASTVPYRNDGQPIYWTQTTSYDLLNRPLVTQTPDDEVGIGYVSTTYAYSVTTDGITTKVTDPKGRVAASFKNSQGQVKIAIRNYTAAIGAVDRAKVDYDYDAVGNLLSTTENGSSTTAAVLTYDTRGRKTAMDDPDMGAWSYTYNSFGELLSQTDAKGQVTRMEYDALGRLLKRRETEGDTTWTYDSVTRSGSAKWLGKLGAVSAPGSYAESYTYDSQGRVSTVSRTIDGTAYTISQAYDTKGRPTVTTYPKNFQTRNNYNSFGALSSVDNNQTGTSLTTFWTADHYAVDGRVDGETYGNGVTNDRVYSRATGRLAVAQVVTPTGGYVQYLDYTYDTIGNVLTREDGPTGRSESFTYDALDRLTAQKLGTATVASLTYDALGNIKTKSDVGTYAYSGINAGPHAVTAAGNQAYTYDLNGNMLTRSVASTVNRSQTWTSFNQVKTITAGASTTTFSFGAAHERVKQVLVNGAGTTTTIYVGGAFELVTAPSGSGGTQEKNYIMTPNGRVAVMTYGANHVGGAVNYFHTDGLGSITAVSDANGGIVQRFAFDAWGKRINPSTGDATTSTTYTRGFTDHEHLDDFGLIHMNGRVYDPVLGRFLSADPNVDGAYDSQGYNRYSYVQNNPLNKTDPSGYFSLKEILPAIIAVVVTAVVIVCTAGAAAPAGVGFFGQLMYGLGHMTLTVALEAGAAGGFASGFSGSLLNGGSIGDAFKSGVIGAAWGAASAAVAYGVGQYFDGLYPDGTAGADMTDPIRESGRALAHGVTQGGLTEAQGGQFRHGFYAASFGSAAGSITGHYMPGGGGWNVVARTAISAVVGGTASVLGGGKFANGATTASFQHMFNDEVGMFGGMTGYSSAEEARAAQEVRNTTGLEPGSEMMHQQAEAMAGAYAETVGGLVFDEFVVGPIVGLSLGRLSGFFGNLTVIGHGPSYYWKGVEMEARAMLPWKRLWSETKQARFEAATIARGDRIYAANQPAKGWSWFRHELETFKQAGLDVFGPGSK